MSLFCGNKKRRFEVFKDFKLKVDCQLVRASPALVIRHRPHRPRNKQTSPFVAESG